MPAAPEHGEGRVEREVFSDNGGFSFAARGGIASKRQLLRSKPTPLFSGECTRPRVLSWAPRQRPFLFNKKNFGEAPKFARDGACVPQSTRIGPPNIAWNHGCWGFRA